MMEMASRLTYSCFSPRYRLVFPNLSSKVPYNSCSRLSTTICKIGNPRVNIVTREKIRDFGFLKSVNLDRYLTSDDEDQMSEGFFEAIEELEKMRREPSDVLEEMNNRLSAREFQLVLVYFSQEGRDSWCALEVFEWLRKENRVDKETMELMVSLMCGWIQKLIEGEHEVGDVIDLLVDMDCVGLKPSFSMIEKVISLYWEMNERDRAIMFVKEILMKRIGYTGDLPEPKSGPVGYLVWKMMSEGNYRDSVKLVINLRESGLKPEPYSYQIAMTAVVKELNELSKALRKLKSFIKSGLVSALNEQNVDLIENYQSSLVSDGVRLSKWVMEDAGPSLYGVVHERLLAMYIVAGKGLEAERQLWEMKVAGKESDSDLYDFVLAICASQKESGAISRLLTKTESSGLLQKKKTLSWLLRGYVKGGHIVDAAETLIKMLDLGLYPELLDRVAVLQGLMKRLSLSGTIEIYLDICKRLCDANLIGPCLLYLHVKKYKLWIIKMV